MVDLEQGFDCQLLILNVPGWLWWVGSFTNHLLCLFCFSDWNSGLSFWAFAPQWGLASLAVAFSPSLSKYLLDKWVSEKLWLCDLLILFCYSLQKWSFVYTDWEKAKRHYSHLLSPPLKYLPDILVLQLFCWTRLNKVLAPVISAKCPRDI